MKVQISLLYQKNLLKCKQVDNNNLKNTFKGVLHFLPQN